MRQRCVIIPDLCPNSLPNRAFYRMRCSFLAPSPPATKEEEREADAVSEEAMEAALLEEEGEVVLVQTEQADGRVDRIVFSSGGEVDVYALEMLCDKVGMEASCRSAANGVDGVAQVLRLRVMLVHRPALRTLVESESESESESEYLRNMVAARRQTKRVLN